LLDARAGMGQLGRRATAALQSAKSLVSGLFDAAGPFA
jgi:hypothetical protein